jgi:hypothetical protein
MRWLRVIAAGQDRTGDDAKPVADGSTGWQAQKLGRHQRTPDAEQAGDLLGRAVDPGSVVVDEVVPPGQRADLDIGAGIEAVVGDLLHHQAGELVPRYTGLLGKAVNSPRSNFKI